jgi:putative FmdB family regulatory protein
MPIYEFKCARCGNLAEVVQRVGARPPPCPACGSKRMARAVSRTAFHLKGGGWYADLYATPRPGADKGDGAEADKTKGAEASRTAEEKPKDGKAKDEKPAASARPEGAGKVTAPPVEAPAKKAQGAPREDSRPPRHAPASPRKRR